MCIESDISFTWLKEAKGKRASSLVFSSDCNIVFNKAQLKRYSCEGYEFDRNIYLGTSRAGSRLVVNSQAGSSLPPGLVPRPSLRKSGKGRPDLEASYLMVLVLCGQISTYLLCTLATIVIC